MEKIAVVSVYYGTLPPYYRLWLRSCEYNSTIDFYLVTDIELDKLPKNVHKINLSFTEFHALAEKKLGRKVCLDAPYKICDYRPMFGVTNIINYLAASVAHGKKLSARQKTAYLMNGVACMVSFTKTTYLCLKNVFLQISQCYILVFDWR